MENFINIYILLAAYNGEKYIEAQIESILNQTYTNWKLIIRDDGSSDNTLSIIKKFIQADKRISLLKDNYGNVGSCRNFSILLQSVKNESGYIMFCDQDDYWKENKIELTLNEMIKAEKNYAAPTPVLVYTNFTYADESLQAISSKKNYSVTKFSNIKFSHIIAQNPAYGCTMMFNIALLKVINTIPQEAENHDYWSVLTASAFGKVFYLPQSTVFYRQHGKNISGQHSNDDFVKRINRIYKGKNVDDVLNKIKMIKVFNSIYHEKLSAGQKKIIDDFILLAKHKSLSLIINNLKNDLKRQTFLQTLLFYISILKIKSTRLNKVL